MTTEFVRTLLRAMGIVCIAVGGFGSMLCVPFALTTHLSFITIAGIYFVAGGVMITGGLITVTLLQPGK